MKKKRVISLLLVATFLTTTLLTGCGDGDTKTTGGNAGSKSTVEGGTASQVSHDTELTLEIYDKAANFQGEQTGWYGKILKDKFNIKLNIIAPQVSGDANSLYQTRSAAGNLGDLVIIDNSEMQDCLDAGLIMDIGDIIGDYENLSKYKEQIDLFNSTMKGVEEGSTYAIPCNMNSNGPTAFVGETVSSAPRVPWDYYEELGCPEMKDTDDLLQVLSDMQAAHPTNADGDKAYAISLWKDWDNGCMENVRLLTPWYGQEGKESVLIGNDNTIMPLTDRTGAYYKMLHFFYQANQMGLIDPDSATQDWSTVCDSKMKKKRVYLFWYNWQNGFWNTPDHGETRENYVYAPVDDLNVYQLSDSYYGDGRVWGLGSQVDEEKKSRIMEFLDWLCTPEGLTLQHSGQEDIIYTVNEDGSYTLTKDGENRFTADIQIPDELGGGLWNDGNNQVNQWIVGSLEKNPDTGDFYDTTLWKSTIERNQTATTKEWTEKFGAVNEVEYMKEKGQLGIVPNVNIPLESDSTDIALIRSQCGDIVKDSSWRMVFASSDVEFDKMWDDMCTQLDGLGWDDLVKFDTQKYQGVIEAREAAE
ncbi:MAG TPA: extracellular solute-binding protein [Candidatus Pelethocola excrementipullorum]|nr:extracellular solute-binding protein [Candidatus Pelethocola excrementipullorum]